MKEAKNEAQKLYEIEESQQVQVAGGVTTQPFKYTAEQYASVGITQQWNFDYSAKYMLLYNGKSIHEFEANSIYEKYQEKCLNEQRLNDYLKRYIEEMDSMFG